MGDVSVSITDLNSAKSRVMNIMQELSGCITEARAAADAAKGALGGSTALASTLESKITSVNMEAFNTANKDVNDMFDSIGTLSKTYSSLESAVMDEMNKYSNQN